MKKVNITSIVLLLYLIAMSVIGWPGDDPNRSFTNYFLMIGATVVVILLLRYLQIKRLKIREKWKEDYKKEKE